MRLIQRVWASHSRLTLQTFYGKFQIGKPGISEVKITNQEDELYMPYQSASDSPQQKYPQIIEKTPVFPTLPTALQHLTLLKSKNQVKTGTEGRAVGFKRNIENGERHTNALQFMKNIDHILTRSKAEQIVRMVERHVDKTIYLRLPSRRVPIWKLTKAQKILFKDIQGKLMKNLCSTQGQTQVNRNIVNDLLGMLSRSDPKYITVKSYQEQISLEETQDYQDMTHNRNLMHLQFSKTKGMGYNRPNAILSSSQDRLKEALEAALRLRDKEGYTDAKVVASGSNRKPVGRIHQEGLTILTGEREGSVPQQERIMSQSMLQIYGLPYDLTKETASELIEHLQEAHSVNVIGVHMFSYSQTFNQEQTEVHYDMEQDESGQYKLKKEFLKVNMGQNLPSISSEPQKGRFQPKRGPTEAMMAKIKRTRYSKFNKSVMVLRMASVQDKNTLLLPDTRLYGINFKNFTNVKIEEVSAKPVVMVSGIVWGLSCKAVQYAINSVLKQSGLKVGNANKKVIVKGSVIIRFQLITQALRAIELLNNAQIQDRRVKAFLHYGPCQVFKSQYSYELVESSHQKLKMQIEETERFFQELFEEQDNMK